MLGIARVLQVETTCDSKKVTTSGMAIPTEIHLLKTWFRPEHKWAIVGGDVN